MTISIRALITLLVTLAPLAARADLFFVEFVGVVSTPFSSPGLAGELPVGTEVRFKLAFDSNAPDTCPTANTGFYREPNGGTLSYLGRSYDLFLNNLEVNAAQGNCPSTPTGPETGGFAVYRMLVFNNPIVMGATVAWSFTGDTPFDPLPPPGTPQPGFWGLTQSPGLSGIQQPLTSIAAVPAPETVGLALLGLGAIAVWMRRDRRRSRGT